MRYREIVKEEDYRDGTFRVSINMNNFYKNMELLKNTTDPEQAPSDLEGIDAVVRLGYMGSVGPESILTNISSSNPADDGFYGKIVVDGDYDEMVMRWDQIFEPTSRLPGTSTTAHELRHRAFQIMSQDQRFLQILPEELVSGEWSDGWGNRSSERYFEGARYYSPEHAMIYAVQFRNIESTRANDFINNTVLGNRGAEYWRNLYRRVNDAAKVFFRRHFDARLSQHMYPSRAGAGQPVGDVYNIPNNMKQYYRAWTDVLRQKTANSIELSIISNVVSTLNFREARDLPGAKEIMTIWQKGYTANIPHWIDTNKTEFLQAAQQKPGNIYKNAKMLITSLEAMREYWPFVDVRFYSDHEFTQIVQGKRAPGDDAVSKRNRAIEITLVAMQEIKAGATLVDQTRILNTLKNQLRELTGAPEDRLNTFIKQLPTAPMTRNNVEQGVDYLLGQ